MESLIYYTVVIAVIATVVSTIVGTIAAIGLSKSKRIVQEADGAGQQSADDEPGDRDGDRLHAAVHSRSGW